jgi:ParB-like chromosome segregation protein Spo0J
MQMSTTQLEVIYLRTTSLKPDPRNPRVHTDKQVRQIAQSIESFGFNVPLLIDDEQKVIAGHGRLLAARKLGGTPYLLFGSVISPSRNAWPS